MTDIITVVVNGVKTKAKICKTIYKIEKKRKVRGKLYKWFEYSLVCYIPKSLESKAFLVIPLNEEIKKTISSQLMKNPEGVN